MRIKPLVLVGGTKSKKIIKRLNALGWGRIWNEGRTYHSPKEPWALDNGAYAAYLNGTEFDQVQFLHRLRDAAQRAPHRPEFVVLPDIVAGGLASLELSEKWLGILHTDTMQERHGFTPIDYHTIRGWPKYLAVQDGLLETHITDRIIREIAGIFVGGSNGFKSTAQLWTSFAHKNDLKCHYGRAGTLKKLDHAIESGVDSLDSAFPLWTAERLDRFVARWVYGNPQLRLWERLSPDRNTQILSQRPPASDPSPEETPE